MDEFTWREPRGWHWRGYHPHCDCPGLVQAIGFRLYDSVPAELIDRWSRELASVKEVEHRAILWDRIDRYADNGYGSCLLAQPEIAQLVEDTLLYFDDHRYDLLAWCIMLNHVHALAVARPGESLSSIVHSWKSYTAHEANRILERHGDFWMADYFDEYMKSTAQLEATIVYIEQNPLTAGFVTNVEDWRYSSAAPHHRERVTRHRRRFFEIDPRQLPDW